MNKFRQLSNRVKLIILAVALALVIIIVVVVSAINYLNRRIVNYDEYIIGSSSEDKAALLSSLSAVIQKNRFNGRVLGRDIEIRRGTFESNYDGDSDIHNSEFIVDIAVAQQSFRVYFQWSTSTDLPNGVINIMCLPEDLMIYPMFECRGMFDDAISYSDPIEQLLPYTEVRNTSEGSAFVTFRISAKNNERGELEALEVLLYACSEKAILVYKGYVAEWFSSVDIDVNNYTLIYSTICE